MTDVEEKCTKQHNTRKIQKYGKKLKDSPLVQKCSAWKLKLQDNKRKEEN